MTLALTHAAASAANAVTIAMDGTPQEVIHVGSDIPDIAVIAVSVGGAALICFVLFVLPIWLFLHYRARNRHLELSRPTTPVTNADLGELAQLAERIEHRLDAMESLMDVDHPNWRRS